MKYVWIVAQRKHNNGFYAYAFRVSSSDNLISKLSPYFAANICETKQSAQFIARIWNDNFIKNGEYAFPCSDDNDEIIPF